MVNTIINDDVINGLRSLDDNSVDCIITSPPYYQLRNYGVEGQLGLEDTVDEFISKLRKVFLECHRVLKKDGTLWIVIGDSYNGDKKAITDKKLQYIDNKVIHKGLGRYKRKTLLMIPSRLAIAMIDDGWILRNELIWHKPNVMPQSIKDRFTIDFEKILFFTKSEKYYFKQQKEPMVTKNKNEAENGIYIARERNRRLGKEVIEAKRKTNLSDVTGNSTINKYDMPTDGMRNKRSVWNIPTSKSNINHFAMFPEKLVTHMIDAGCKPGGVVLDPFCGSGTTLKVAKQKGYNYIGIDLNAEYVQIAKDILSKEG